MCELVLDWAHQKWLDDDSVEIDETFMEKSTLLIMSKNNSLKDCKDVEEGSAQDSDLIQDYKKSNQHLDKPKVFFYKYFFGKMYLLGIQVRNSKFDFNMAPHF